MTKNKLHTALTVCIDVQGLRSFITRATVENLGGVNDNPVMFELCQSLTTFIQELPDDEKASVFAEGVGLDQLCSYKIKTTISDQYLTPAFFTVCDLLGYGLFSFFHDGSACDLSGALFARFGNNLFVEDASRDVCRAVIEYAVPSGLLGAYSFSAMESDIKNTSYSVPPRSGHETVLNAYKAMALDGLFKFNAMVLPFIKLYIPMDVYLFTKDID